MDCKLIIDSIDCIVEIDKMKNVIKTINWSYICVKGDIDYTVTGALEVAKPDVNNFIPVEDIDSSILKNWVESMVDIESMRVGISKILDDIKPVDAFEIVNIPIEP